jgi:hypothetical protein
MMLRDHPLMTRQSGFCTWERVKRGGGFDYFAKPAKVFYT